MTGRETVLRVNIQELTRSVFRGTSFKLSIHYASKPHAVIETRIDHFMF
ncbi:Uncharacterised protein [Vibrio cholerae]|nr:Uncharacterised protein [Vibrio cholerae]